MLLKKTLWLSFLPALLCSSLAQTKPAHDLLRTRLQQLIHPSPNNPTLKQKRQLATTRNSLANTLDAIISALLPPFSTTTPNPTLISAPVDMAKQLRGLTQPAVAGILKSTYDILDAVAADLLYVTSDKGRSDLLQSAVNTVTAVPLAAEQIVLGRS